jgi:hypothetical protein
VTERAFRQLLAVVATSREGHRTPRSGPEVQSQSGTQSQNSEGPHYPSDSRLSKCDAPGVLECRPAPERIAPIDSVMQQQPLQEKHLDPLPFRAHQRWSRSLSAQLPDAEYDDLKSSIQVCDNHRRENLGRGRFLGKSKSKKIFGNRIWGAGAKKSKKIFWRNSASRCGIR